MQITDILARMGGLQSIARELGGLASMLDLNGDGNPLDDIMQMIGKGTR